MIRVWCAVYPVVLTPVFLFLHSPALGAEVELPAPTGPCAVGRIVFHWTDPTRPEPLAPRPGAHREVMVYVWYPARTGTDAPRAPYFPHAALVEKAVGEAEMRDEFGAALPRVRAGRLRAHAVENAQMPASGKRYPVLIFSHGFGETGLTYAALLEDLASHGYVVAAVEHPYDAFCVVFSVDRVVPFAQEKWNAAKAKPGGRVAYQVAQIPIRAADIRFVLDQLVRADQASRPATPLTGRLNLERVGVFGHSLGGMAAARACEGDQRIRAGMNQDSDYEGVPFIASSAGKGITQPFLFFATDHSIYVSKHKAPPNDAELARDKLTRAQHKEISERYQKAQDASLATLPGGSYRVSVETPGFTHRSFIDLPLLKASDDPAAVARNLENLRTVRTYTRAFFDKYLKGRKDTLLDQPAPRDSDSRLRVERFGPTSR
jgi:predicted dienelactone hydrolase